MSGLIYKKGQRMSIKKLTLLMGLCVLLTGCSTGRDTEMPGAAGLSDTEMGKRYLLGRSVAQNDAKAFSHFKRAADDGDPFAQNEVAYLYAAGKGTPRDDEKAFSYYQQAASKGLASAQYSLGQCYLYGIGTQPNKTLAMQWFQKSAAHGFEPAKQALTHLQ
jgi:TPR repeat protein